VSWPRPRPGEVIWRPPTKTYFGPLTIPTVMDLVAVADVRALLGHLPREVGLGARFGGRAQKAEADVAPALPRSAQSFHNASLREWASRVDRTTSPLNLAGLDGLLLMAVETAPPASRTQTAGVHLLRNTSLLISRTQLSVFFGRKSYAFSEVRRDSIKSYVW
jgi:hypothetical protein